MYDTHLSSRIELFETGTLRLGATIKSSVVGTIIEISAEEATAKTSTMQTTAKTSVMEATTKTSVAETTVETSSIQAIVINIEVVKTDTSFLAIYPDTYLHNGLYFLSGNT